MSQQPKTSNKVIIVPLVILLVASIASIIVLIFFSVQKVNQDARLSLQDYVSATLADKLEQHEALTKDYAYWDDTIKYGYLAQDKDWIDENLGEYLTDTFHISDLFILNGKNDLNLSLDYGKHDNANYLSIDKDALLHLVKKARKSAPIPPVPVSGILLINNTPALVAVSILSSDYRESFPSPRPVLIKAIRLDDDYIQKLSRQYRLNELAFNSASVDSSYFNYVEIKDPLNKTLGKLIWKDTKPGNAVLSAIDLPLFVLIAIVGIIGIIIVKASNNIARKLDKAYKELEFSAYHDSLTGLANRQLFSEMLDNTISKVKRDKTTSALLFIDMDDFKHINDEYGHNAGDQLLITVAERINTTIRESDYAARIGGDEFVVLLNNIDSHDDIRATTNKILIDISRPVNFLGEDSQFGISIGAAIIPDDGTDSNMLISKADLAMYECKKAGKNTYKFYSDLE